MILLIRSTCARSNRTRNQDELKTEAKEAKDKSGETPQWWWRAARSAARSAASKTLKPVKKKMVLKMIKTNLVGNEQRASWSLLMGCDGRIKIRKEKRWLGFCFCCSKCCLFFRLNGSRQSMASPKNRGRNGLCPSGSRMTMKDNTTKDCERVCVEECDEQQKNIELCIRSKKTSSNKKQTNWH